MEKGFTSAEKMIYELLLKNKNQVTTIDDIDSILRSIRKAGVISSEWNYGNLVAVHIRHIRNKLPVGKSIETVRGKGYRLITSKRRKS